MKKRALSWLLAVVMVVSLAPQIIPQAEAAEEKDAFGITLKDDDSFNASDLKDNPYGTDGWFPLITKAELVESRTKRDRGREQYVYRYGDQNSYSRTQEASFNQGKNYSMISTAAFDYDKDGRKELIANLAYDRKNEKLYLYTTDSNGQKGSEKLLEGVDFLKKVQPYHATSHMAIVAGDFDGDGKDTIVVYEPNGLKLVEYEWNGSGWSAGTQVTYIGDTLGDKGKERLGWVIANDNDGGGDELRATPSVQLAVDDTDKDGKDELVVASSWNDLEQDNYKHDGTKDNANWQCSWVSVFDQDSSWKKTFNQVLEKDGHENAKGRLRFAGVTVGDVTVSGTPEIVCVGYRDQSSGDGCDVDEGTFGLYTFKYDRKNKTYNSTLRDQEIKANGFSKGGCYDSDKIQDPVAVVAFASRGKAYAEDLFIEGDVYRYEGSSFTKKYNDDYFNHDDDGIGRFIISNGGVSQAIAANFDGNIDGKEEVVFSTVQKYKHGSGHFWKTRMYRNTGSNGSDNWSQTTHDWSMYHDGETQVSLTAADIGKNDGTQAKIKSKTREYSKPQVLAILEAPPYFSEIAEGDIGNSTTEYGKATGTGKGEVKSTKLSTSAMVGFEYEDAITGSGGGFEATISNEWTWETEESVEREEEISYSNDSGDNAVVVFRTPVINYEYEVRGYAAGATKNNRMMIGIQGEPSHSMISVDDYNAAADQFGLDPITDDMIGSAGNPSSYHEGLPTSKNPNHSWSSKKKTAYSSIGTVAQSVTDSKSTTNSSSYEFTTEVEAFISVCGAKAGAGVGGGFGNGTTTMNSESTSKTGAVTGRPDADNAENYNFTWEFATWTQHLNGDEVPVLGYLLTNITAPPSPAENLALSEQTKNSMKLTWEAGDRPANEYRVYRYDPNNTYSVYTQVGTVSGGSAVDSTYTYLLSRLDPNTTYQYVVTGYSLQNGESVYSELATGTTLAGSGQSLVLDTLKNQSAQLGEEAVFKASIANYGDYSSTGFEWQEKLSGSNWKTISGARSSTLTVTANNERIGAQYRCIVYGITSSASAVPYYTNAAKLTIGQNIHPSLTIDKHGGGSGTQAEPYTGTANYPILTKNTTTETVKGVQPSVQVMVDNKPKEALVYKVYEADEAGSQLVATVMDENNKTHYFAVTKTDEGYKAGEELNYSVATNFQKGTETYTWPSNNTVKDGVLQPLFVEINGKTYYRYIGVKGTFAGYTLPKYNEYGDLTNAGQITTEPVEAKLKTVTELDNQYISADGRTFYAYIEGMSSLPAAGILPDGITAMELYQSETSGVTLVGHLDQDLVYTPETKETRASWEVTSTYRLYEIKKETSAEGETTTTYTPTEITSSTTETLRGTGFTTVTDPILAPETTSVDREVTTYTESTNAGREITLSVTATKSDSTTKAANADYTIRLVNQSTGAVTTLTGKTEADGKATQKWTADAPGLYAIQVITGDNVTPTQYYLASGPGDLYSLTAEDSKHNVVTTATYGDTVSLKTTKNSTEYTGTLQYSYSINGGKGNPIDSATGKPKDEVLISTPSAFRLPDVGTFTLYVKENNKTLASTVLTVEKRAITLEPIWTNESTGGPPAQLIDITKKADNLASGDSLDNIVQVVCPLYKNGTLDKTQSGAFTVSLDYMKDSEGKYYTTAVQTFLSHYQVTLKTAQILRKLDTFPIYYKAGENGKLEGRWGDGGNSFASGSLIEKGQPLRFQATPNGGYVVDSWTVNGTKIDTNNADYKLSDDRTILTVNSFSDDMLDSNQQMKVVVSFKSDKHTISYHVNGGNGELTATTSDNKPVGNGGNVAEGTSVTFTAKPDRGYSIEKWVVDDVEYTWPDSKALYRSKTLTLENISKSHKVEVYFTNKAAIQISTSLINEDGNATSAAKITVADVTDASKTLDLNNIESGSSLLFTAIPGSTNIGVREWQTSTDGTNWQTIHGSGGQLSCTLYNLTKSTQVRAVLTTAQSYRLDFKVQQNGTDVIDTNIATLTAKINKLALTSGHSQPAYSQVDFELELSEDYYVVGWTGASDAEGNKTTSARLDSLTKTTTVIVNIQEKPKVTVTAPENGTVEVTGTRTGTGAVTLNGTSGENGHVDLNSKVTISATPNAGYFVQNIVVTVDGKDQTTDYDTAENYQANDVTLKDIEITKDTSITVNFAKKPVVKFEGDGNITVTAKQGDNELTSGQCVEKYSDYIVFTAKPKVVGYETASWTVDEQPIVSYQTVSGNDDTTYTKEGAITSDVTVSVTGREIPQPTLTMSVETIDEDGAHGTLKADVTRKNLDGYTKTLNESGQFYRDSNLTIIATPENGYRVQNFTWNVKGQMGSGEVLPTDLFQNVQGDAIVTVRFVKLGAGITFTKDTTGGKIMEAKVGELDVMKDAESGVTLEKDASITLTAEPQTGYEVKDWLVNSASKGTNSKTFTYTSDGNNGAHIRPVFQPVAYTINFGAAPSDKGTVIATGVTDGKARGGKSITFTADPGAGNKVIRWTINGEDQDGSGNTLTWTVPLGMPDSTSYDILAILTEDSFTLNYSAGEHGGLTATANGKTVESGATDVLGGTKVTFTATPEEHYEVDHWTVGGQTQNGGNTLDVTVVSNTTVSVTYKLKQYSVDLTQGANGDATATKTGSVDANTQVTFNATPATGYHLSHWLVNGKTQQTETNTLTLTITGNTEVQPVFEIDALTVNYGLASGSKQARIQATVDGVALTSGRTVPYGSDVTFTVTPSGTDMVESWSVDGAVVNRMTDTEDAETTYEVKNVTSSKNILINVIDQPSYTVTVADNITNGSVSIVGGENGTITVPRNGSVTLKATAEDVYHMFGSWSVDGKTLTQEKSAELKLDSIRKNTTVSATFRGAVSYNVTLNVNKTAVANENVSVTVKNATQNQIIQPGTTSERSASVLGGSKLVFTANDAEGNTMVGAWKINDQVQDNLSKEMVINGLTGAANVEVTFEELALYDIPTAPENANYTLKVEQRIPDDYGTTGQIRKNGTLKFTLTPKEKSLFTQLTVNGVNCLEEPKNGSVTAVKSGTSYTITIPKVTQEITLSATAAEYHLNSNELTEVPRELGNITMEQLKTTLRTHISSSVSTSNIAYLNVELQYKSGNTWVKVTDPSMFPDGGLDVTIPYSTLSTTTTLDSSYNYSVVHMFLTDMNNQTVGSTETLTATAGTNGITFHVNSLSPFAIGWYKNTPTPGGGGGGGGGVVSTYTLTFDTNGGSAIDKITKDSGTTIDLAAYKPTRAGYTFAGWFSDKALTKAVTSVKLTANTTVYAKWTQNGGTAENPFVDVKEGTYYYDAVLWAVEQKITSGTSATTFSPDASCTRAQMVTFLWRAAGSPKVENGKNPFTDVQADAYYYDAVLWAVEKGVTSGTSATTFSPDATVTRGQTVTFLYRNAGSPEVSGTMPFTDVEADAYYAKAVQWAVQQKITTGTSETTFSPMSDCTRGQIVTFLYRAK